MTAATGGNARAGDCATARDDTSRSYTPAAGRRLPAQEPVAIVDVRRATEPPATDVQGRGPQGIAERIAPRNGISYALRDLAPRRRSAVHVASLALVWLAVFLGGVVVTEPAPVDVLNVGLAVLLPAVGLAAIGRPQLAYLVLWLVVLAAGAVAAGQAAVDPPAAVLHLVVSTYLCLTSFVLAAFVARRPEAHARLIFNAWTAGGIVAALLGIAGFLGLVPGGLFTVHQRAAGLFKDPNVYAPFLIPPMLHLLHATLSARPGRAVLSFAGLAVTALAMLLSFSRGAWAALAVAVAVYALLTLVTARTHRQRVRLVLSSAVAAATLTVLVGAMLQFDSVGRLFEQRVALDQSYDVGPEGRFGGQLKAISQILDNPLGIGALQFGSSVHHEQPHNVYLSMYLSAGWVGGTVYLLLILTTAACGLRAVLRRTWPSRTLLVSYAAFLGMALEGLVIDTDHWRHFYLLMALLWGQMLMVRSPRRRARIRALHTLPAATTAASTALRLEAALARLAAAQPSRAPRIVGAVPVRRRAGAVPRSRSRRQRRAPRPARIVYR